MPELNGKTKRPPFFLNLLTALFNLGSITLVLFFVFTYLNPYHPFNPFPPEAPPELAALALTATSNPLPTSEPTATETLTEVYADTETPPAPTTVLATPTPAAPTATLPPFPTATPVVFSTPEASQTEPSSSLYKAHEGSPSYRKYPSGCSGIYLAGNITDINQNPVMLMTVRVEGTLGGQRIFQEVLSGSSPADTASGWEIKLSDTLIASTGTVTVALYPQGRWEPISEVVAIDTFDLCSQNLIVVNFIQE